MEAELQTLESILREPGDDDENDAECLRIVQLVEQIGLRAESSQSLANVDEPPGRKQPLVLGQYELAEKLGEGGMGAVYRARHAKLDKFVALKILPADRLINDQAVSRFEREMRAVGKLKHPNIVAAHDAGEIDGTHFLVMELVEGIDLSTLVRRCGPLPVAEACEVIRQVAQGLQHAHEFNMVHRDIKPGNLMLTFDEQVKILDMGLALLDEMRGPNQAELTNTGQLMGTLDYMAPEQGSNSHAVDIRADIYSLGATLFKLLTGEAPFAGPKYDSPVSKLMALAVESPRQLRDVRPEVPEELSQLVSRMLAKSPAERPATPQAVVELLEPFAVGAQLAEVVRVAKDRVENEAEAPSLGTFSHLQNSFTDTDSSLAELKSPGKPVATQPTAAVACQPPRRRPRWLLVATGVSAATLLLVLGIWVIVRDQAGNEVARFEVPQEGKVEVVTDAPSPPGRSSKNASNEPVAASSPVANLADKTWVQFINLKSGHALSIEKPPGKQGMSVRQQNARSDALEQHWRIESADKDGAYRLRNRACNLVVALKSAKQGEGYLLWPEEQESDESLFTINDIGHGQVSIVSRASELAMSIWGADTKAGQWVIQWPFAAKSTDHRWTIMPVDESQSALAPNSAEVAIASSDPPTPFPSAGSIEEQKAWVLAELKRLNPSYDGKNAKFSVEGNEIIGFTLDRAAVDDIAPLAQLEQLSNLTLNNLGIEDLSPLASLPIEKINLMGCRQVCDLSPLADCPITELTCHYTGVGDLSPLVGKPLTKVWIGETNVADLSPLAGMPIAQLYIRGSKVHNLATLKGMPLEYLDCSHTNVAELSPLAGQPLRHLDINHCQVRELAPLKDIPLEFLDCEDLRVTDLSPLAGMPLKKLNLSFNNTLVDISPLKGVPLEQLFIKNTKIADVSPLAGMPLTSLDVSSTRVVDLTPLASTKLISLTGSAEAIAASLETLRKLSTLRTINGKPSAEVLQETPPRDRQPE